MTRSRIPSIAADLAVTLSLLATISVAAAAAAAVAPAARPDQPDAPGRQTLSLDGDWEIVFDPGNAGREGGWHKMQAFAARNDRRPIRVPSCWEQIEKDYEGVAFYGRRFRVPDAWKGKTVRLQFDAVNFAAEVWLNDQAAGFHEGGFTPFTLRVDDLLKFGEENMLIVRVAGPILLHDKRIEGVGPMETPQWRAAIAGGIWQPVRLIATGGIYLKDVFIMPRISDGAAAFHMVLENVDDKTEWVQLRIAVSSGGGHDENGPGVWQKIDLQPGENQRALTVMIPHPEFWSPDHPFLYQAQITVSRDGAASDRWTARFGMREFTVRDKQFCLNGRPMYLKAAFFEGLYPANLAYPDSREMAAREIRLAKEAGFNMIRPWRKPPPPMWLDLADEMGVLTVGSLAVECMNMPIESARLSGWVENEVRESILRDRSRTCVVQWELFNEISRPVLKRMLHPMSMLARRLDPTRVILDESGGWAQGANLYLPYESEPMKYNDIHAYPGPQITDSVYQGLLLAGRTTPEDARKLGLGGKVPGRNVVPGLMTYVSELGYGSLPDLEDNNRRFAEIGNPIVPPAVYHKRLADEHRQAIKASGFEAVYPDLSKFCLDEQRIHGAANRRMIEAVRCDPAVQGYCIHALTDGDWIIGAGLLDMFRNPKTYAYEGTKAACQPRILSIRVRPRNVYAERGAQLEVTGVNELDAVKGKLKVEVTAADGTVVLSKTIDADMAAGIAQLFSERLDTKSLKGAYCVKATITAADGRPIAANECAFDVFAPEQLAAPKRPIAVLDPGNLLKPFLKQAGIAFTDFEGHTDRAIPVFVPRTEAKTPAQRQLFGQLAEFVRAGGTAVYLHVGGPKGPWDKTGTASPLLPVRVRTKQAIGAWNSVPHLVHDHPVFRGLPVNCMMGGIYENVWADHTLLDTGGETIVAAIGYDWYPDLELRKRHYYGPGDTWWGADVAQIPLGSGRCIVSQLRLVENLGKDPVADKILFNLIDWTTAENGGK